MSMKPALKVAKSLPAEVSSSEESGIETNFPSVLLS